MSQPKELAFIRGFVMPTSSNRTIGNTILFTAISVDHYVDASFVMCTRCAFCSVWHALIMGETHSKRLLRGTQIREKRWAQTEIFTQEMMTTEECGDKESLRISIRRRAHRHYYEDEGGQWRHD